MEVEKEELKNGEERTNGLGPVSPLPPCQRILPAPTATATATATATLLRYTKKKKTRDLSSCYSRGICIPSKWPRDHLRILRSEWRIVLLCKGCLADVESAEVCSYCFSKIAGDDEHSSLDCIECCHRVHIGCIPHLHPYLPPSRLNRDLFACIDCCPLLKPRDSAVSNSRVSVMDTSLVLERKMAAEHALRKAVVARNALDAVLAATKEPTTVKVDEIIPDDELALQLHRAMNGSQRIMRNPSSSSSDCLVGLKKLQSSRDLVGRDAESDGCGVCVKVEVSIKDKFFDIVGRTGLVQDMPLDMAVKEEHGSCSEKVGISGGDDNSIGSASLSCQRPNESDYTTDLEWCTGSGQDSYDSKQKEMGGAPDRYLKKYIKRRWRLWGMGDSEEGQIVPCRQLSCSEGSKSFSRTPHQPLDFPVRPSTCAGDLSRYQS